MAAWMLLREVFDRRGGPLSVVSRPNPHVIAAIAAALAGDVLPERLSGACRIGPDPAT